MTGSFVGGARSRCVRALALGSLVLGMLASAACSSDASPQGSPSATGGGGAAAGAAAGGSAGAGAGGHGGSAGAQSGGSGGPATLWSRAGMTCNTLGEDCSNCGSDTVCYDNPPNACVPHGSGFRCSVGSCVADPTKPYCIDDFCLTLNDASCFCTADPGKNVSGCAVSPADQLAANAKTGACHAENTSCGSDASPCCAGNLCTAVSPGPVSCIKICTTNLDCSTGCCAPVPGGSNSICSPASSCTM